MEKEKDKHMRLLEKDKFNDHHENEKMKVNLEVKKREMILDLDKERIKMEKERLDGMKSLGADITSVLVAECKNADKTFKIENHAGDQPAKLHIHEN